VRHLPANSQKAATLIENIEKLCHKSNPRIRALI
jgi:hypothetical protein